MPKKNITIVYLIRVFLSGFILMMFPVIGFGQTESFIQTSNPNVFKNEAGHKIEYIGLQHWSAQQVMDSLKSLAPDKPVHACMAVLEQQLHFPEAFVGTYANNKNDGLYTVVTLVEPHHKDELKYEKTPTEVKPLISEWTGQYDFDVNRLTEIIPFWIKFLKKNDRKVHLDTSGVSHYGIPKDRQKKMIDFLHHLLEQDQREDRQLVYYTLKNDANELNRLLAQLVLLNFENSDSDINLLFQLLPFKDKLNALFTYDILRLATPDDLKVDWNPSIDHIKRILNGTNIAAFQPALRILTKTSIDPGLANEILSGNTWLLEAHLRSEHEVTRKYVLNFLRQISGINFDNNREALTWLEKFS